MFKCIQYGLLTIDTYNKYIQINLKPYNDFYLFIIYCFIVCMY